MMAHVSLSSVGACKFVYALAGALFFVYAQAPHLDLTSGLACPIDICRKSASHDLPPRDLHIQRASFFDKSRHHRI